MKLTVEDKPRRVRAVAAYLQVRVCVDRSRYCNMVNRGCFRGNSRLVRIWWHFVLGILNCIIRKYSKRDERAVWVGGINKCLRKSIQKKTAGNMRTVICLQKINTDHNIVNSCAKCYKDTHKKHKQVRKCVIKIVLILK
jgi:hypothetical protein